MELATLDYPGLDPLVLCGTPLLRYRCEAKNASFRHIFIYAPYRSLFFACAKN